MPTSLWNKMQTEESDRWQRVRRGGGGRRVGTVERDPSRNEKVTEEDPPNLQIVGWLLNSAYTRKEPRFSWETAVGKLKEASDCCLLWWRESLVSESSKLTTYKKEKIPQRKLTVFWESIIYITNIQHTSEITWLAKKEEMCRTVKRKSRQKKLTHKIIKLLIGISRKEILRKVKTIFKVEWIRNLNREIKTIKEKTQVLKLKIY